MLNHMVQTISWKCDMSNVATLDSKIGNIPKGKL